MLIEVYTGNTFDAKIITYDNGVPVAPNSAPIVNVRDVETGQLLTTGTSTLVDELYEGEYSFQVSTSLTAVERILELEWIYSIDSTGFNVKENLYVVTPYISVDEVIDELGYSSFPQDPNYQPYEKIHAAARVARMMINDYLGFSMGKYAGTLTAYGAGSDTILFDNRLIEVNKLYENGKLVIDIDNNINEFGYNVEITETGMGIRIIPPDLGDDILESEKFDYSTGNSLGKFKDGYRYTVEGVVGWNYIPLEIKQSMILLINDLLCSDSTWRTKYLKKINNGQFSVELSSLSFNGTGNAIVDNILNKFKMIQAVVI